MTADELLHHVATAYEGLRTLVVEVVMTNEFRDGENVSHGTYRSKAWFEAPSKIRIEAGGRIGMTNVADGEHWHQYFGRQNTYTKLSLEQMPRQAGQFNPQLPFSHQPPFLFQDIASHVTYASLSREGGLDVLTVDYATTPGTMANYSPVIFRVDPESRLVVRMEVTQSLPPHDVPQTNRFAYDYNVLSMNEPIPPETFTFRPPSDALDMTKDMKDAVAVPPGAGGPGLAATIGPVRLHSTHPWVNGNTMLQSSQLKLGGREFRIERRLTLSPDGKRLEIGDTITGPHGSTEHTFTMPLE